MTPLEQLFANASPKGQLDLLYNALNDGAKFHMPEELQTALANTSAAMDGDYYRALAAIEDEYGTPRDLQAERAAAIREHWDDIMAEQKEAWT